MNCFIDSTIYILSQVDQLRKREYIQFATGEKEEKSIADKGAHREIHLPIDKRGHTRTDQMHFN